MTHSKLYYKICKKFLIRNKKKFQICKEIMNRKSWVYKTVTSRKVLSNQNINFSKKLKEVQSMKKISRIILNLTLYNKIDLKTD